MKAESFHDMQSGHVGVTLYMEGLEYADQPRRVLELALRLAAETLAAQIVKDHGQEIIAKCDMQAIATLTVAEAANAIRETIHKKLPDVIEHHHHTETHVYQRGILGGYADSGNTEITEG